MEILATPVPSRSQRALTYNDLKRRRLQRSVSQKKMTIPQQTSTHSKRRHLTEQKSLINNLPKDEKVIEGVIDELKNVLGDIRRKKSEKRFFSLRESMTDRPSQKQKQETTEKKVQPLWSNVDQGGQTKQFIRLLLNKNKSQRRLMRFNEVRDKFKMEKQKSRSISKSKIVKEVVSPYKNKATEVQMTAQELKEDRIVKETSKKSMKKVENRSLDEELDKLEGCPPEMKETIWKEEIAGKQNQERANISMDPVQISEIRKYEEIDESCQQYQHILDKTRVQGSFLKLLQNPNEIENRLHSRQTKRRGELDRLRRIFPVGFFAN